MSKILAIFGATGQQGSSLVEYVLKDAELSKQFKVRAITRDVGSEKAKQLATKVEVVQADVVDKASLNKALAGVHTVFAMTMPTFGPDRFEVEYNSAKNIADVAVEERLEYIIFSTLPPAKKISGGKYTMVSPFDAKAAAAEYIRGLNIKSAFYCPGSFMENFQGQTFLAPRLAPDGTWVMIRHNAPEAQLPLIAAVEDTGKFVGAILAEPDKHEGKTFYAASGLYSLAEITAIMSKTTGKKIIYKQVSAEEFRESIAYIGDTLADIFVEGFSCYEEFGYFGPEPEKLMDWAKKNARGKITTFEEFSELHPLQLEESDEVLRAKKHQL